MAINAAIGAIGTTVTLYDEPGGKRPTHLDALAELTQQLKDKKIDTLLILGGNPAYDAPADLGFAAALKNARVSVHLSQYEDETSQACTWHRAAGSLSGSLARCPGWDGTVSVCQPLIEPLYDGKTIDELLALLAGDRRDRQRCAGPQDIRLHAGDWRFALAAGAARWNARGQPVQANITTDIAPPASVIGAAPAAAKAGTYELRFLQDSHVYDGRFAGNGWLQEMPDPLTKLVWDNAALISKKDADALASRARRQAEDHVRRPRRWRSPPISWRGSRSGVIGLPLGYGRTAAGHIGTDVGFNTYSLRTSAAPFVALARLSPAPANSYELATTQNHHLMDSVGSERLEGPRRREKVREQARSFAKPRWSSSRPIRSSSARMKTASLSLNQQLYDPPATLTTSRTSGAWRST